MAIGAYLPEGNLAPGPVEESADPTGTVATTGALSVGDWVLVLTTTEHQDVGGQLPPPIVIAGTDTGAKGGLHPTGSNWNVWNRTGAVDENDNYTTNNSTTRWIDLGYQAGGYNGSNQTDIKHFSMHASLFDVCCA